MGQFGLAVSCEKAMCCEKIVVSYVLLISCKLFQWNKYKTYPSLYLTLNFCETALYIHPFRKVKSQAEK
jgi:hypothetical protein